MCFNLFGWLPSPAIYGMVCQFAAKGMPESTPEEIQAKERAARTSNWGMIALT